MGRIEVIWRETTSHLLETCSHPHAKVGKSYPLVTSLVAMFFNS
jgi:hypothetical protein